MAKETRQKKFRRRTERRPIGQREGKEPSRGKDVSTGVSPRGVPPGRSHGRPPRRRKLRRARSGCTRAVKKPSRRRRRRPRATQARLLRSAGHVSKTGCARCSGTTIGAPQRSSAPSWSATPRNASSRSGRTSTCGSASAKPPASATPQTPQERVYAATVALNAGDTSTALDHLTRALSDSPESDHAHYIMSVALASEGRFPKGARPPQAGHHAEFRKTAPLHVRIRTSSRSVRLTNSAISPTRPRDKAAARPGNDGEPAPPGRPCGRQGNTDEIPPSQGSARCGRLAFDRARSSRRRYPCPTSIVIVVGHRPTRWRPRWRDGRICSLRGRSPSSARAMLSSRLNRR